MELLGRDRTICGGLFAAQRVRNHCLTSRTLLSSGEDILALVLKSFTMTQLLLWHNVRMPPSLVAINPRQALAR
jgi:hypothetical protein